MSRAYHNVLPFVILNLGGEMVYILEQRLRSQDINKERSQKVLQDIIKSMLAPKFVEELFRTQPMYTMQSTKQIFEKLAHSSIMKLNATSMQKLFDLMLMGFKYQLQGCCKPIELFHVTMNHIKTMIEMVKGSQAQEYLQATSNCLSKLVENFTNFDYIFARQEIFKFFQEKHIKVSLFIQDGIQGLDGSIYLDFCGFAPEGCVKPGTITFFNNDTVQRTKMVQLIHSDKWSKFEVKDAMTRPQLGANLYAADREKPQVPWKPNVSEDKAMEEAKAEREENHQKSAEPEETTDTSATSKEFNLLASLICQPEKDQSNFKLNLFPEQFAFSSQKETKDSLPDENMISIDLGKQDKDARVTNLIKEFSDIDMGQQSKTTGDDLLDMMDNM